MFNIFLRQTAPKKGVFEEKQENLDGDFVVSVERHTIFIINKKAADKYQPPSFNKTSKKPLSRSQSYSGDTYLIPLALLSSRAPPHD